MANLDQILQQLRQQVGFAVSQSKQAVSAVQGAQGNSAALRRELERQAVDLKNISDALSAVKSKGVGYGGGASVADHIRYIEQIPGRRVPFDMLVSIPISANATTVQQGTLTVSQDGPFIASARFAAFQSTYQFSVTDEGGSTAAFQGRSYGRYRPIHSMWDSLDAAAGVFQPTAGAALPGTGAAIYASPSNHSSFRSMEWDGLIQFMNQGSAYPRSNIPVPSAFWTSQVNSPFQLGALDFFERGETMQWQVTPTHTNNPAAGNVSAFAAPAGSPFPFLDSQYDVHEGIVDPGPAGATAVTPDAVSRLPDGILIIGFHGFRVIQPPGPVAMS